MQISSKIMFATNISMLILQNMNEPVPVETQIKHRQGGNLFQLYLYLQEEKSTST